MDVPKRIVQHAYFTRDDLVKEDTEENTMIDPLPGFRLVLVIPECDTCKRGEDDYNYGLYLDSDVRPALIEAGMYSGHPANVFQNKPAAEAAKIFNDIVKTMLSDPMKYMDMLANEGGRSQYERTVRELMAFATRCETFTTAHTAVPGAM